jgi:hypothetical protein
MLKCKLVCYNKDTENLTMVSLAIQQYFYELCNGEGQEFLLVKFWEI